MLRTFVGCILWVTLLVFPGYALFESQQTLTCQQPTWIVCDYYTVGCDKLLVACTGNEIITELSFTTELMALLQFRLSNIPTCYTSSTNGVILERSRFHIPHEQSTIFHVSLDNNVSRYLL